MFAKISFGMKEVVSNKIALNFMFCLHSETFYRFHGNTQRTLELYGIFALGI